MMDLADREHPFHPPDAPAFFSLVPLPEVLGEILGVGPGSKEVLRQYGRFVARFGSEFGLLLHATPEEIREVSPLVAEAVTRIRAGRVIRHGGYDGEFGTIRVFEEGEVARLSGQAGLFADDPPRRARRKEPPKLLVPAVRKEICAAYTPSEGPNPEQEVAVSCTDRQVLVAAGPGTGKTYTLVARITALLAGMATMPERVCVITFTNRAAREVRERLMVAVDGGGERVFVGTFHRFCLDWLRREEPGLAVVGEESRERILKRIFPELGKKERRTLADGIANHLNRSGFDGAPEPVRRYLEELAARGAVDLDAVIPFFARRLTGDDSFRQRVCGSVAHLFVDEFQDLNAPQFALVEILAREATVFAIGDPDQAIYGFRGSDPSFFFRFADHPVTRRLSLIRNYRSAPPVVEAASAVIARNSLRSGLVLVAGRSEQGMIELHRAPSPAAEAEFIVRRIEELMGGVSNFSRISGRGGDQGRGRSFGEMAVLYRLARQAEELASALERRGIPFQLVGAVPYFLGSAVRGVTRFIQAAAGSTDIGEWLALLGELRGIGAETLARLEEALPLTGDFLSLAAGVGLPPTAARQVAELAAALERFRAAASRDGIAPALGSVLPLLGVDAGHADVCRLVALAGSFGGNLAGFARHLRDYAAETLYDERAEGVPLMTLHAAKGLEFPVVFLAGCEEGLLPCTLWRDADVEEERRLFYVGMTRARESLILTASRERPWCGPGERPLSRFVGEIPARLVTAAAPDTVRKGKKGEQMELF